MSRASAPEASWPCGKWACICDAVRLEVISHADGRHGDNLVAIRIEVGLPEARRLGHKAPVLHADVEARAQLISQATAEQPGNALARLGAEQVGPTVQNRGEDERAHSNLGKGAEAFQVEAVNVGHPDIRSEKRRIGKERRSRWSPD